MVVKCSVFHCSNRKDRNATLEFYRLPAVITNQGDDCRKLSEDRRRSWLANLGQDFTGKNVNNVRICSAHFISGKKADLYDRTNPDWAPTVNLHSCKENQDLSKNSGSSQRKIDRYKRAQERASVKEVCTPLQSLHVDEVDEFQENFLAADDLPIMSEEKIRSFGTQTDITLSDFDSMEKKIESLQLDNRILKEHINSQSDLFSAKDLENDDEKVKHLTGLSSFATLMILFNHLEPYISSRLSLDKFKMFILTLMRLRLGVSTLLLSYMFNVSQSTVSRIFNSVIDVMYVRTQPLIVWPEREQLQKTMPMEFRKHFGTKCISIIDCFEVFIERPSSLIARAETWSSYKHHNTIKFLISITPQGSISYISTAWGGRTSDKYITEHCGFLDKLLPGDLILADRGFDISDSVGCMCAHVKIPAFTKGQSQLSPVNLEESRHIAHARIHVERVIGLVRQKYTILNTTLPITFLDTRDEGSIPLCDKVGSVCCALVNLCDSVVDFN